MHPFPQSKPLTHDELVATQALLDHAGYSQWRVSEIRGHGGDASLFRAERVAGGLREVASERAEALVELVAEVEARSPATPIAVASGELSTESYK
jgi:hypothetical protein